MLTYLLNYNLQPEQLQPNSWEQTLLQKSLSSGANT